MDHVAVTVLSRKLNISKDLVLPLDVPQYMLIDEMIKALQVDIPDNCRSYLSIYENGKNKELPIQSTLRSVGTKFGQFITLGFRETLSKATLICFHGPEFDLVKNETLIGCSSNVDVDLRGIPDQEYVSGIHAKIICKNDVYYLMDLQSTNGTKINEKRIPANVIEQLNDEDEVVLGASENNGVRLVLKIRK